MVRKLLENRVVTAMQDSFAAGQCQVGSMQRRRRGMGRSSSRGSRAEHASYLEPDGGADVIRELRSNISEALPHARDLIRTTTNDAVAAHFLCMFLRSRKPH